MLSLSSPGVHFRNDSKAPQLAREVNDGRGLSIEVGNKVHVNVDMLLCARVWCRP
jgi:hypothetical protein